MSVWRTGERLWAATMVAPLAILGTGAVLVYLLARLITRRNEVLAATTALLLVAALLATLPWAQTAARGELLTWPAVGVPTLRAEPGAALLAITALVLGLGVALYSGAYLALDQRPDRYYPLLLLMLTGLLGMVSAADLFTLYLLTVLTNASVYVLLAFRRSTETAIEAGFKYAITGSLGSVMMLAGVGYCWRATGTLTLPLTALASDGWHLLGLALITFGLLIKAAVFPAHAWLPDAHGRAPSSVSALLSGILVPTQLYALVRLLLGLAAPRAALGGLLVGLACCSMLTGNVLALRQSYGKRLLGYSTVAQVGYMAAAMGLGMAYEQPALLAAGLLLLVAHGLLKGVAFLAKGMLHLYCNATTLDDLDGLGRLAPFASGHLAAVLVGLAGVPPLAGFVAKFSVLWGLAGAGSGLAYAVGAFYLVNSLVSLGYYLPLIGRLARGTAVQSATAAQDDTSSSRPSLWMRAPVAGLTLLAVLLGVCPGPVWRLAEQTAAYLLAWGS